MTAERQPLDYQGHSIRKRDEILSLTDMWRAAGSPENREPYNWSCKEGASFVQAVALAHNLTEGQVMKTRQVHSRLGRLLTNVEASIERAADHTGGRRLRVAELAGLVHLLAGQAEIRDLGNVPVWNNGTVLVAACATCGLDLAPRLCGVVFIRQPALGLGLDFQGICLGPMGTATGSTCGAISL